MASCRLLSGDVAGSLDGNDTDHYFPSVETSRFWAVSMSLFFKNTPCFYFKKQRFGD
jgi:hypothetical protein